MTGVARPVNGAPLDHHHEAARIAPQHVQRARGHFRQRRHARCARYRVGQVILFRAPARLLQGCQHRGDAQHALRGIGRRRQLLKGGAVLQHRPGVVPLAVLVGIHRCPGGAVRNLFPRHFADKCIMRFLHLLTAVVEQRVAAAHDDVRRAGVHHLLGDSLVGIAFRIVSHEAGGGGVAEFDGGDDAAGFAATLSDFQDIFRARGVRGLRAAHADGGIIRFHPAGQRGGGGGGVGRAALHPVKIRLDGLRVVRRASFAGIGAACQPHRKMLIHLRVRRAILVVIGGQHLVEPHAVTDENDDVLDRRRRRVGGGWAGQQQAGTHRQQGKRQQRTAAAQQGQG
ncbi:MAG: hypothetical protein BWY76_02840 [bacterium ADurb.Bin429]|nr:MAG: hypothetical protein BWY76_02840 [bacterium ADurb.Bin429]